MQLLTPPPLPRLHEMSLGKVIASACGEGLEKEHRWKGTPLSQHVWEQEYVDKVEINYKTT